MSRDIARAARSGRTMRFRAVLACLVAAASVLAGGGPGAAFAQDRATDAATGIYASGRGVVDVAPDRAIVLLGATVQDERADVAQQQVNRILEKAIDAIRRLGIHEEDLQTAGLSLQPVYSNPPYEPRGGEGGGEPRIVGYRASNVLRVRVDAIDRVGSVIDAGVREGANEIQGISFDKIDPAPARQEALRRAVAEARGKAQAMAEALGVRLGDLLQATESGSGPIQPYGTMLRMEASQAATQVQPGRIEIEGTVTLRYAIER
ncbi:MAG: SIMPL domain-containing protein [Candidatus Eisenbacteria bacterium]|nr:SIMPL domain-containing protein [Candidatus Eisenbacteria bacterium]